MAEPADVFALVTASVRRMPNNRDVWIYLVGFLSVVVVYALTRNDWEMWLRLIGALVIIVGSSALAGFLVRSLIAGRNFVPSSTFHVEAQLDSWRRRRKAWFFTGAIGATVAWAAVVLLYAVMLGPVFYSPPPQPRLPAFPWPPPTASAEYPINSRWIVEGAEPNLSQVAERLESALVVAGYEMQRYLQVPHGFALVTQLERIAANGKPRDPRFGLQLPSLGELTFLEFLAALAKAPPGQYRVFAFIVTDVPFAQSDMPINADEARRWMRTGLNQLPRGIGSIPYTREYRTTALIYEFRKDVDSVANLVSPSEIPGWAHLQTAGIWLPLTR